MRAEELGTQCKADSVAVPSVSGRRDRGQLVHIGGATRGVFRAPCRRSLGAGAGISPIHHHFWYAVGQWRRAVTCQCGDAGRTIGARPSRLGRQSQRLRRVAPRVSQESHGSTLFAALLATPIAVSPALAAQAKTARTTAAKPDVVGTVNINTASATELEKLPGIGPKTAGRIIEYRQKNGSFKKIEELMNVRGVGEKNFLKLRTQITAGGAAKPGTAQP